MEIEPVISRHFKPDQLKAMRRAALNIHAEAVPGPTISTPKSSLVKLHFSLNTEALHR